MSQQLADQLKTIGQQIVQQVGSNETQQQNAIQAIWDAIYATGATTTPETPPRPVSPKDYVQGITEGYEQGYQDGRKEAA